MVDLLFQCPVGSRLGPSERNSLGLRPQHHPYHFCGDPFDDNHLLYQRTPALCHCDQREWACHLLLKSAALVLCYLGILVAHDSTEHSFRVDFPTLGWVKVPHERN